MTSSLVTDRTMVLLAMQPEMFFWSVLIVLSVLMFAWLWYGFFRFKEGIRKHDRMPTACARRYRWNIGIGVMAFAALGVVAWVFREPVALQIGPSGP